MRRISGILILLLLLTTGLFAQQIEPGAKFKLLNANYYEVEMFHSSQLQRLFLQVDFDLPKSQVDPASYLGVFLPREARLEGLWVAGFREGYYFVNNLAPGHFQPVLPDPGLLAEDSAARFHGLSINNYEDYPDVVHFTLKYYINMPEFALNQANRMCSMLSPAMFWYPRNLSGNSTLKMKLTTTPYFTLQVGNSLPPPMDQDFKRKFECTVIDMPEQPLSLRLMKD